MKKTLLAIGIAFAVSCTQNTPKTDVAVAQFDLFGEQITEENALEATIISKELEGKDTVKVKVKAKILDVCQTKGCWMNVDLGNNQEMQVRFKDYGFFVPKDAAGKEVIFEGLAFRDTTSVEDLKHYAQDAGQSQEEIDKITEPEISISFEASGVMIKK